MALHKFTPGGCRQDCDSVDECCHPTVCQANSPTTEYTVAIYKSGVLQCSWTLDQHVVATHPTAGYVCYWYASAGQAATICGTAATYYAVLNFYTGGGLTGCGIAIRTTNYPSTTGTALSGQSGSLGASPADCGVSFSGSLTNFDPSCTETWTYQVTAGATPCSTTGTTAGSGGSCCPCEDCQLFRDYFNRAAGTDLGANWTEAAGSWEIVDPSWAQVSSASAMLLSASAASQVGVKLLCVARAGADGDKLRVLVCYQDANDYVFAEWVCGSTGSFTLYRRSGGSDTEVASGVVSTAANTPTTLTVCVSSDGTEAAARLIQGGASGALSMLGGTIATAAAGKYGLATGDTATEARFTRVELSKTSAGCENCAQEIPCYHCSTPSGIAYVDFGTNPFAGSARDCCADFGGQYELEQYLTLTGCASCPWTPYNSDIIQIHPQLGCLWVFTNDDCGAEFDAGTTFIAAYLYWGEYGSSTPANKLWWIVYARTESAYAWYRLEVTSQQITPGAAPGTEGSYLSDCQQTWTLDLDSSRSSGTWCGGSWPATVTVEMPTP